MRKWGLETRRKEAADSQETKGLNSLPNRIARANSNRLELLWWSFINSPS